MDITLSIVALLVAGIVFWAMFHPVWGDDDEP